MEFNFKCRDQGQMLAGLMFNVVAMQVWLSKMATRAHGDLTEEEMDTDLFRQTVAEHSVDLVVRRFGEGTVGRADMEKMRAQLVALSAENMSKGDDEPNPPRLKLV